MKTKLFSFFFALAASVGIMHAAIVNGTCGANLTWTLNTEDGSLVIEGTGAMNDYEYQDTPWCNQSIPMDGWYKSLAACIKTITITEGVTSIGDYAFSYGAELTSITIPNSVTRIGRSAFQFCYSLTSITLPHSITKFGYAAFEYCGLTDVYISDLEKWCNIESKDDRLFFSSPSHHLYLNNEEIISLVIPNGVTSIGAGVFSHCFITDVTIPNSVTTIGAAAFADCANLSSVTMGNSVTSIMNDAFGDCLSLSSIILKTAAPPSVLVTCSTWDGSVYSDCYIPGFEYVDNIYVPCGSLEAYQSAEGWSLHAPKIKYAPTLYTITPKADKGRVSVPDNLTICDDVVLTAIPDRGCYFVRWADGNTDNPRTIELTQDTTMEAIFDYLLTGNCGKDSALTWTLDTTKMALNITGQGALSENYTYGQFIESLTIGNEVTQIGVNAFSHFEQLKNVILGSSVKVLESYAFYLCSSIETITCYSQRPPTVYEGALYGLDYSTIVYVPADYLETYKMHDIWGLYDVRPLDTQEAIEDIEGNNVKSINKFFHNGQILIQRGDMTYTLTGQELK